MVVGALFYLGVVFYLLKKQKLAVQYAIIWLISGFVLLIFAIFPYVVLVLGDIFHVLNPVNFIFLVTLWTNTKSLQHLQMQAQFVML